ncbi:hypothetical protein [Lentzea flava]|uniref:Proteins of 100 residues with WXG n=1 Tax=Lentzea flava TaxID=103732 RepID=A0ABQ2UWV2_9PSEU|nr:hypothetical protein [Lentzea flava]MCP2202178.1 hypothetical protein [Lentzea flava]GGU57686.1 hypothetical protein GCM10010178_57500 [Lentzea flava]
MTAPETPLPSPPGMKITEENKLKGSLFIEAYGSLIDGIGKDAESETEKALDITFNAIGAASATVMLAIDPLGSLIGAGVGWLIEHVSFLRDALNQVMGNPEEIQANVEATKARAAELRVLAEDHKKGLATFDGWSGTSSERFKASMDGMAQELDELASAVETKAKIVAIMGMLVTVLRDIVRDLIAQLIGSLIGGALIAAATMIPTFGASIPAFIGFAVGKAVALGTNIASRIARVVAALGRQMKRIGDLDDIMAKISKGWERFENSADVAEISYEGWKASKDVDKKIDEAVANNSGGGGGGTATATAPNAVANARVGTVQADSTPTMHALSRTQADSAVAGAPVHAVLADRTVAAQPMHTVQADHTIAAQPMHALQPMQLADRTVAAEPMHAVQADRTVAAEPFQAAHRAEAVQPTHFQAAHRVEAVQPMHAADRLVAAEPMHEAVARTASDSTVASGVSMTAATPVHEAVLPMQAQELYSVVEPTPEPMQQAYQPMAPTPFEVPEADRENHNPLQARTAYASFEAPVEAAEPAAAYETTAQSGGAPVQPLRQTVAHERSVRPSEQ